MFWISPSTLTADKGYMLNGVKVSQCLLKDHNANGISLPSKRTNKFKGVVIHNTDIANSDDDGRQYTAATLNDNVATRTHYYVTNLGAWKNLEDDDMNWSCGDGTVGEGNNGCISLEIIMGSKNKPEDLKARDNGARLAAVILYANDMTVNDMYTHNYFLNIRDGKKGNYMNLCTTPAATRNCPYFIVWDWEGFRQQVSKYIDELKGIKTTPTSKSTTTVTPKKRYLYKAVSQAAMREGPSKNDKLIRRVNKGNYYIAEPINDTWIKHYENNTYSMLVDNGRLFEKVDGVTVKKTKANLNIRKDATVKSVRIATLSKDDSIFVLDEVGTKADGYTWKKVFINHSIGFAAEEFLN